MRNVPSDRLMVGAASEPIVVDGPVPMSGFAARTEPSTGTHGSGLWAVSVAIGDISILVLDVIGVDEAITSVLEHATESGDGRPLVVTATHTHAGPAVMSARLGPHSPQAAAAVVEAGTKAVREARRRRRPARLEVMEPIEPGLAYDRRHDRPMPGAELRAFRWIDDAGAVQGSFAVYPCHPVTIGPSNRLLSGDYPAYFRRAVTGGIGGTTALFATGPAGDANTGHSVAASYALDAATDRSPEAARHFGEGLADVFLGARWRAVRATLPEYRVDHLELDLTPLSAEPVAAQRARWSAALVDAGGGQAELLRSWLRWAERPDADRAGAWGGAVQVIAVGPLRLCFLPGEPFVSTSVDITRALTDLDPSCYPVVAGYSGDVPGYFPPAAAYAEGGYEIEDAHRYYGMAAPFASGSAERLAETVTRLAAGQVRS